MYKLVLVTLAIVFGQCTFPVQRQELGALHPAERDMFFATLQQLHQKSDVEDKSLYDGYARLHQNNTKSGHGHPHFLPWHRQFIRNLEKDLQAINAEVVLPYWDWTKDYEKPHESYIFQPEFMGGNGRGRNKCIKDGPFHNWTMANPNPHCLARDFDDGETMSPLSSPKVISKLLHIKTFSEFSERLELVHGSIHNNVGGERGDMLPQWSPNDPIFFLHHVFIDMLWWNWQQINSESDQFNGFRDERSVRASDVMCPFGVTVASVLRTNTKEHCYTYPSFQKVHSEGQSQTSFSHHHGFSLGGLLGFHEASSPKPKPLSRLFITMSSMDEGRVRRIEKELLALEHQPESLPH